MYCRSERSRSELSCSEWSCVCDLSGSIHFVHFRSTMATPSKIEGRPCALIVISLSCRSLSSSFRSHRPFALSVLALSSSCRSHRLSVFSPSSSFHSHRPFALIVLSLSSSFRSHQPAKQHHQAPPGKKPLVFHRFRGLLVDVFCSGVQKPLVSIVSEDPSPTHQPAKQHHQASGAFHIG